MTGSTGGQILDGVFLYADELGNCTKLVDIQSPNVSFINGYILVNLGGHVVYGEDENNGANIFVFGLSLGPDGHIYGDSVSGHYGVRLGLNSQGSTIVPKEILNCGTGVAVQGACERVVIKPTVIEDMVDFGIDLSKTISTPVMAVISIEEIYFEGVPVAIHTLGGEFHNISIRKNRYSAPAGGKFYWGDVGAAASSDNIFVKENDMDGGLTLFQLDGEYTSHVRGTKGNALNGTTNYTLGSFANNAYSIRVINSFFGSVVTGTLITNSVRRLEAKLATVAVQVNLDSHEYLEKIIAPVVTTGTGTGVTVELHSINLGGNTDTVVLTGTRNTTGNIELDFNGYPDPTVSYYLLATWDNTDTSAFLYPYQLYLRQ